MVASPTTAQRYHASVNGVVEVDYTPRREPSGYKLIGDGFAATVDRPGRPTITWRHSCLTSIPLASTPQGDGR